MKIQHATSKSPRPLTEEEIEKKWKEKERDKKKVKERDRKKKETSVVVFAVECFYLHAGATTRVQRTMWSSQKV